MTQKGPTMKQDVEQGARLMTQTPAVDIVEQEMPRPIAPFGFDETARQIVDSDPVISTYAAPEWDELHDDGKVWISRIVEQAWRAGQKVKEAEIEALRAREAELQRKLGEAVDRSVKIARDTIIDARTGEIDSDLRSISHILAGRLASIRGETE